MLHFINSFSTSHSHLYDNNFHPIFILILHLTLILTLIIILILLKRCDIQFYSIIFMTTTFISYEFLSLISSLSNKHLCFSIIVIPIADTNCIQLMKAHTGAVTALSYTASTGLLASAGRDNFIHLFNIAVTPAKGK